MRSPAMAVVVLALALLGAAEAAEQTTRLYVRTVPSGATVFLDGQELGMSDGLFEAPPGEHEVRIVLAGHYAATHHVSIPANEITRLTVELEVVLQKEAASSARVSKDDDECVKTVRRLLERSEISEVARDAMLAVLRQHPTERRWSGQTDSTLFAVAAKRLPPGEIRDRMVPPMLEVVHSRAVHELLKAKSLLDRYAEAGLTDTTTLRTAAGTLDVTGEVEGVVHATAVEGDFVVGYVLGDESRIAAHLTQPAELAKVKAAYRDVMHDDARKLMQAGKWADAIVLWRHLHQRKLVSENLYLDAARCFKELGQTEDAVRVLVEAYETFGEKASAEFLEKAGDVAVDIDTPCAQDLAVTAYKEASRRLTDTTTR